MDIRRPGEEMKGDVIYTREEHDYLFVLIENDEWENLAKIIMAKGGHKRRK